VFTAVVCRLSLSVVASLGVGRARSRVAVCSIVQVAYVFASVFRAGRQDAKQRVPPVNDQRRWSARSPASPRPASDSSGSRGRCPVLAGLDRRWGGGVEGPGHSRWERRRGPPRMARASVGIVGVWRVKADREEKVQCNEIHFLGGRAALRLFSGGGVWTVGVRGLLGCCFA